MNEGELWLITGSSKGLGKCLVDGLADSDNAIVHGYSRGNMSGPKNYHHHKADLSDKTSLLNIEFPDLPENCNKVVLINNAASLGEIAYVGSQKNEEIIRTYVLNVIAPHILINKCVQQYQDVAISIINISSGAATSPYDGWNLYCSSKAAIQMLTEVIHKESEISNLDVKVHAIAPGVLDTEMQAQIRAADTNSFSRKEKFEQLHQNGDLKDPNLAAGLIIDIAREIKLIDSIIYRLPL